MVVYGPGQAIMGQAIRGQKKRDTRESHRITIQLQSENGEVEVLEVDETEEKKDTQVKDVVVEKTSEMVNLRRVSIIDRSKKLHTEDEKLEKMDKVAVHRRKELETLLKEEDV